MKLFGKLTELLHLRLRKDQKEITLSASSQVTYTGDRTVELPPEDTDSTLVSETASQTLTNKRLTGPQLNEIVALTATSSDLNQLDGVEVGGTAPGSIVTVDGVQEFSGKTLEVSSNTIVTAASGNLTATELNSALAELQTDIDTRATSTDLSTHENTVSGTHGVTGDLVGTTDSQELTNKTLTSPQLNEAVPLVATSTDLNQLQNVSVGGTTSGSIVTTNDTQTLSKKELLDPLVSDRAAFVNQVGSQGASDTQEVDLYANADRLEMVDSAGNVGVLATTAELLAHEEATLGVHGVTGDLVGTTDSQTLTNKTLLQPTTDILTFAEQTDTPETPELGYMKLYPKDDRKFYTLNASGDEIEVGSGSSGSGGGGNLYVLNPDAELNLDNTSSSFVPITIALETASPLAGEQSFKITSQGPDGSDRGWAEWATKKVDEADKGRLLKIKAVTRLDIGDAGDFEIGLRYVSDTFSVQDIAGTFRDIPANLYHYEVNFACPNNINTSSNSLIPVIRDKNATAGDTVVVDRWSISNDNVSGTAEVSYYLGELTTTGSWTTNTAYSGRYWRKGSWLEAIVRIDLTGAPDNTALDLILPDGLEVDRSRFPSQVSSQAFYPVGQVEFRRGSTFIGQVSFQAVDGGLDRLEIHKLSPSGSNNIVSNISATLPDTWASGDYMLISYRVPITEWADSEVNILNIKQQSPLKAGFIYAWAGPDAPPGSDFAEGKERAILEYPELYASIGHTWDNCAKQDGTGGNWPNPAPGYFREPDLRGVVLRGVGTSSDSSGNQDVTVSLAGFLNDTIISHTHSLSGRVGSSVSNTESSFAGSTNNYSGATRTMDSMAAAATGSTETRGRSQGVHWLIKLYDDSVDLTGFASASEDSMGLIQLSDEFVATETKPGLVYKNKYQIKSLSANATTTGTSALASMNFSNLVIGKTYKITAKFRNQLATTNGKTEIEIYNGATRVGESYAQTPTGLAIYDFIITSIFTATDSTITYNVTQLSASHVIEGNGTIDRSHAILEELNNYVETSDW